MGRWFIAKGSLCQRHYSSYNPFLGVKGGVGFAYEFAGPAIEKLSMEGE